MPAYATAAWLLAQLLEVAQGPWGLSDSWIRGSHLFLAAGLPIAGVLAWFHGERGRQKVTGLEILAVSLVLFLAGVGAHLLGPVNESSQAGTTTAGLSNSHFLEVPRLAVLEFDYLGADGDGAGFYVAGRIIEVLTGVTLYRALHDLVFDPLGLDRAFSRPVEAMTYRLAAPHTERNGRTVVVRPYELIPTAAGGVLMSISALMAYARFTSETVREPLVTGS